MPRRAARLPAFLSKQVAGARRFHLPSRSGPEPAFGVVCAGWERVVRGYRICRSNFKYYGLELVVDGRGSLQLGGRDHELRRGVAFAYGPGVRHEIASDADDRLAKYFVDFAGVEVPAALAAAGFAPGDCRPVIALDEIQAALEQLLIAGRRRTPNVTEIVALQGRILLLLLADARPPDDAGARQSYQTFLRCRAHFETHFATIRTADEAARACGVAAAYLSRLFRRFAGVPAYQFLMSLKMHHAAGLLERGERNVGETAETLGMDPFHFSRAFKRVHGRAPSAFIDGAKPESER